MQESIGNYLDGVNWELGDVGGNLHDLHDPPLGIPNRSGPDEDVVLLTIFRCHHHFALMGFSVLEGARNRTVGTWRIPVPIYLVTMGTHPTPKILLKLPIDGHEPQVPVLNRNIARGLIE